MTNANVLIIGAGQAGAECAFALRSSGVTGAIVLIGEEATPPYHRPPLSKGALDAPLDTSRLLLRAAEAYARLDIEVITDERVEHIDALARQIVTASGRRLGWNSLVLATGSSARRVPELEGDGVHVIRTLEDAQGLRDALQSDRRLLVVGAGYLGLEVAATAARQGLRVAVIEQSGSLLGGRLSSHITEAILQMHRDAGVAFHFGVGVRASSRSAGTWTLRLSDDTSQDADVVLVAVGAVPNDHLALGAGIVCRHGIEVDDRCRTSIPGIWAIGDCASAPRPQLGSHARVESVFNALAQARVAAADIVGKAPTPGRPPTFWSDQYGRRLQIAGLAPIDSLESEIAFTTKGGLVVERYRQGCLAVVEAIDSPVEFVKASQRIGQPAPPSPTEN